MTYEEAKERANKINALARSTGSGMRAVIRLASGKKKHPDKKFTVIMAGKVVATGKTDR